MKYPFIIITSGINSLFLAGSKGPVIFIRPEYKDNEALYLHELEHIKQFWRMCIPLLCLAGYLYSINNPGFFVAGMASLLAHNMIYEFSRPYRFWAEAKAYKAQAMGNDDVLPAFAKCLATIYDLRIMPSEALERLRA